MCLKLGHLCEGRPVGLKAASYATKLNANAASAKRSASQSAATFTAALEYRRQQQALADTTAVSVAAAEAAALEAAAEAAVAGAAAAAAEPDMGSSSGLHDTALPITAAEGIAEQNRVTQHAKHTDAIQNGASSSAAQKAENASGRQNGFRHAQYDGQCGAALDQSSSASRAAKPNSAVHPEDVRANGNGMTSSPRNDQGNGDSRPSLLKARARAKGAGASSHKARSVSQMSENGARLQADLSASQQLPYLKHQAQSGAAQNGEALDPKLPSQGAEAAVPQRNGVQQGTSSTSSVADDAMAAAIASIQDRKVEGNPQVPSGGKAIPAPAPNTSPRIKSALLAAQEYRKQKAAKTAALAVAAATAAAAAAQPTKAQADSDHAA